MLLHVSDSCRCRFPERGREHWVPSECGIRTTCLSLLHHLVAPWWRGGSSNPRLFSDDLRPWTQSWYIYTLCFIPSVGVYYFVKSQVCRFLRSLLIVSPVDRSLPPCHHNGHSRLHIIISFVNNGTSRVWGVEEFMSCCETLLSVVTMRSSAGGARIWVTVPLADKFYNRRLLFFRDITACWLRLSPMSNVFHYRLLCVLCLLPTVDMLARWNYQLWNWVLQLFLLNLQVVSFL